MEMRFRTKVKEQKSHSAPRAPLRNPMFPRYDVLWSRAIPRLRAWLRRCSSITVRTIYPGTSCTCRSIRYKRTLNSRENVTLRLNKFIRPFRSLDGKLQPWTFSSQIIFSTFSRLSSLANKLPGEKKN